MVFRLPDDFKKPEFATVNIQRDLFYGYDTLMENVSDPSHIDFAHHKVLLQALLDLVYIHGLDDIQRSIMVY